MSEAIVVMERGAALPDWVDVGGESSVWILAQQEREPYSAFAARVIARFGAIGGAASQAVLVHGPDERACDAGHRRAIIAALCARMRTVSGRVVLVPVDEELVRAA